MLKSIRKIFHLGTKKSDSTGSDPDEHGRTDADGQLPSVRRGPAAVHHPIPESDLDPDAVKIVKRLTRFDHSAYLVGGCVRDLLLDLKPKDFDIGTSATPRQVRRLFRNCRIIGRRFRLAHVYFQNGKIIEVATFRARDPGDGSDGDGADQDLLIRDDNLFGTMEEDALRRDFTINSLFYDVNRHTVLDHASGLDDLRRRLVRTIGDPEIRFKEDPIRILRAVKFAARLGFTIETGTMEALLRTRSEIPKAAPPRVLEELNRFCRSGAARRSFQLMRETEVFDIVLPEIAPSYADWPRSWDILFDVLELVDREYEKNREVSTGVILAALLLPVMFRQFGWSEDGSAAQPAGLDIRSSMDETLRPMAVRLRMARKDQEYARQTLETLYRMVPARRTRRATQRSVLRRASAPAALRFLESLAARFGGEFEKALEHWKRAAGAAPVPAKQAGAKPRPASRRRRDPRKKTPKDGDRPGDRPSKSKRSGDAVDSGRSSRASTGRKKPSPWDDDYFFAALPTTGGSEAEEEVEPRERTTAADGDKPAPERSADRSASDDSGRAKPKRKRRPRRRRRPGRSSDGNGTSGDRKTDH